MPRDTSSLMLGMAHFSRAIPSAGEESAVEKISGKQRQTVWFLSVTVEATGPRFAGGVRTI
jgi:hypothetical protein